MRPFARAIVVSLVFSASSNGSAADKTSLACIQASDEGQTARENGNLLRAKKVFAACAEPKCPALIRRDCTSWLEEVRREIPSVVLGARDALGRDVFDARILVDGVPVNDDARIHSVELDPGPHLVRWERAGDEPFEIRIALRLQEKNRLVVATLARAGFAPSGTTPASSADRAAPNGAEKRGDAASPTRGLPFATYVLGGVGVAALGTFAYFGLRAKRDSDDLRDTCAPGCPHEDVAALKTKLLVADVALGAGLASLAAAAIIALRRPAPSANAWTVRWTPTARGARAEVEFCF